MNRQPFQKPPRWWSPKMSPRWIRFWRHFRNRQQVQKHHLVDVQVEGLESEPYPLAIFPEGEVYHINDRLTPFREGPAAIALMAARKASRPVVCIPCAMKYRYVDDPTDKLLELMSRLEDALFWQPRPDLPLSERIYRLAEGMISLKEIEFLGQSQTGPLPSRIRAMVEAVLTRIENRYAVGRQQATIPERVKQSRQQVIHRLEEVPEEHADRRQLEADLDDLFLVVQAFSYPGDYVSEQPTIERIAETLDKFEEDLLGVTTATVRGSRRVAVTFGEPIPVLSQKHGPMTPASLTAVLENRVQGLLDQSSGIASGSIGIGA